ncbi:MAG: hypothetical protein M1818_002209 [Claussenomyces sp. TS43310]|nr:MAG: hypothetical protein M1818_002209 [Claussenomyces sp. TS43310]
MGLHTQESWQALISGNPWSTPVQSDASSDHLSPASSRTSSQGKAYRRFVRDLKKHLIAEKALREASLTTSSATSPSHVSAHTISEFRPYIAEFHAAGLAVTSRDQRGGLRLHSLDDSPAQPMPRHGMLMLFKGSEMGEDGIADPRDEAPLEREPSTVFPSRTSGATVMNFSPVLEISHRRPSEPSAIQKSTTRRTLPWLRRTEMNPVAPQPAMPVIKRKSSLADSASAATTIIDFRPHPSEYEGAHVMSGALSSDEEPDEVEWHDVNEHKLNPKALFIDQRVPGDTGNGTNASDRSRVVSTASRVHVDAREMAEDVFDDRGGVEPRALRLRQVATTEDTKGHEAGNIILRDTREPSIPASQAGAVIFPPSDSRASPWDSGKQRLWGRNDHEHSSSPEFSGPRDSPIFGVSMLPAPLNCEQCGATLSKPRTSSAALPESALDEPKRYPIRCSDCLPPRIATDAAASLSSRHSAVRFSPDKFTSNRSRYTSIDRYDPVTPLNTEQPQDLATESYSNSNERFRQAKLTADLIFELERGSLSGDPAKRPPSTGMNTGATDQGTTSGMESPDASLKANISMKPSDSSTSTVEPEVSDRDILRGLRIALVAACDPQLDDWIREISGSSVRRFLADLKAFEGLSADVLLHGTQESSLRRTQAHRRVDGIHRTRDKSRGRQNGGYPNGPGRESFSLRER